MVRSNTRKNTSISNQNSTRKATTYGSKFAKAEESEKNKTIQENAVYNEQILR
jgi:hypothetical protein